ncbi:MAG: TonB-dependent receptor, partial [Betaproteobacteria bacterium]|nr:TonB-dependent receptor [Betaproteobacteria bacterium]
RASQLDSLDVRHHTYQATHRIDFRPGLDLTTMTYYTRTERAWYKLNDVRNAADTGFVSLGAVLGEPGAYAAEYAALSGRSSAPGALRVRNNAREYYAAGVQSVLGAGFDVGAARHDVEVSLRYHRDEEDRFQQDDRYQMSGGVMLLSSAGAPGSQDNRIGEAEAWSFFLRDTIEWDRLTLAPGLRYENISLRQTRYGAADPGRAAPTTVLQNDVAVLLPGLGATYGLGGDWKLVGGMYRGFVNPSPGSSADAETSWNYETGVRFNRGFTSLEAVAFLVDYDNLVGTCTASTGGGCNIGDQFDGGTASVHGLELVASYDAAGLLGTRWSLPLSAVYTWTAGKFTSSFNSSFSEWGNVTAGDELPLVPEHQLTLNAGVEAARWRVFMSMNRVEATRSRAGSGAVPLTERVDGRALFDLSGEYRLSAGMRLFGSVQNLTDEVYNVAF